MSSIRFAFVFMLALTVLMKKPSSATHGSWSDSPPCVGVLCTNNRSACDHPCTCSEFFMNGMKRGRCSLNVTLSSPPPTSHRFR
uniref:Secreted protein n=1 Tax=Rhipicephalus zambeziensis TaxID=60191 RepID=A0A224YKE9_9ACAR